jgi:hypothetical protein
MTSRAQQTGLVVVVTALAAVVLGPLACRLTW